VTEICRETPHRVGQGTFPRLAQRPATRVTRFPVRKQLRRPPDPPHRARRGLHDLFRSRPFGWESGAPLRQRRAPPPAGAHSLMLDCSTPGHAQTLPHHTDNPMSGAFLVAPGNSERRTAPLLTGPARHPSPRIWRVGHTSMGWLFKHVSTAGILSLAPSALRCPRSLLPHPSVPIRTTIPQDRVFCARFSYAARRVSWGVDAAAAAMSAVAFRRAFAVTR